MPSTILPPAGPEAFHAPRYDDVEGREPEWNAWRGEAHDSGITPSDTTTSRPEAA